MREGVYWYLLLVKERSFVFMTDAFRSQVIEGHIYREAFLETLSNRKIFLSFSGLQVMLMVLVIAITMSESHWFNLHGYLHGSAMPSNIAVKAARPAGYQLQACRRNKCFTHCAECLGLLLSFW